MSVPHPLARTLAAAAGTLLFLGLAAPAAHAHPLGNFSLNHYLGFTVHPDRIELLAVDDAAEIPTLQEQPKVDANGDGTTDDTERHDWAARQCARLSERLRVSAGPGPAALRPTTTAARFDYQDGTAGLRSSRLECRLRFELQLPDSGLDIHATSGSDPQRVGWNEITARGQDVTLTGSDVPDGSISGELREYPRELLDSPSGVTHARFHAAPGTGTGTAARALVTQTPPSGPAAWLAGFDARLAELGTAQRLTVPLGLLAVLLSLLLGAGHALLPGHGKTVMAAYLAGRHGRTRDAVTVGATVTATHTAGVLVIGLSLTTFSSLAGDVLLGWLGVVSGVLVTAVGLSLLREAVRNAAHGSGRRGAHRHSHSHSHEAQPRELAHAASSTGRHIHRAEPHHSHDHDHPHGHDHGHHHDHDHPPHHSHDHGDHPHSHDHGHHHGWFGGGHHHHHGPEAPSRGRLIGLGIAGGLIPSPSALVVLLAAVALGRTLFGAALVLAYGLGMAATLTAVGLLLVRAGDRLRNLQDGPAARTLRQLSPYSALLTTLLVLTMGIGLVLRSLPSAL
ncbi:high frequency lysogenization protein HflD [Kitasatospora sp. NPDC051853]|uniref:high frequency lysogenization protein HflD n=1 Tax=Kitasatospora sp. NPDC051853 TaxID=3364058 RepID=UPI0037ADA048